MKRYFVYMLRCGKGALYTGYTGNLKRRLREHEEGRASRFTRARLPVRLVYSEKQNSVKAAMRRERSIKAMTREKKLALISKKVIGSKDQLK
jgi:predicted GIY-YIG superfamily endonuclease